MVSFSLSPLKTSMSVTAETPVSTVTNLALLFSTTKTPCNSFLPGSSLFWLPEAGPAACTQVRRRVAQCDDNLEILGFFGAGRTLRGGHTRRADDGVIANLSHRAMK